MSGFGERLAAAFTTRGRLCVGIDPHAALLAEWGLPDDADGAERFGRTVVEQVVGQCGIVKPQVAFFERFGSAGFRALERVTAAAREAGLLVIADAKRGDIGSTMAAYAEAWFAPGAPLESDALTVSPYLGAGALDVAIDTALAHGKGIFVLAVTSNPEGYALQSAALRDGSGTVARGIIEHVTQRNSSNAFPGALGDVGVVLGATANLAAAGVDVLTSVEPAYPVLAPGFGHQGARYPDAPALFAALSPGLIVSESRGVLAGPPGRLHDRVRQRSDELRSAIA